MFRPWCALIVTTMMFDVCVCIVDGFASNAPVDRCSRFLECPLYLPSSISLIDLLVMSCSSSTYSLALVCRISTII
ncbi:hypothetical protein BD309DRAFT_959067, partial [Dichomitus squalens]|uniref:Uncharacterized protein n=1 Tax=Dichomitus squalens TaxID=114155 RepID=A0A4Q9N7R3_9APHY